MTPAPGIVATSVSLVTEETRMAAGQERARRWGVLIAGIWLIWLFVPIQSAWQLGNTAARWVGIGGTLAFSAVYLVIFGRVRERRMQPDSAVPGRVAAAWLVVLTALGATVVVAVGQAGMATVVYVAIAVVILLPVRVAAPIVVALAAGTEILSRTVDGWTDGRVQAVSICVAALVVWGITQLMNRNIELMRAREENARLAVEEERNRLARDLHDILGHSLTVITVKAELAGRLMDVDLPRARAEVADLERLSRDALVDVRRAVDGYRELSLPGELARAREALRAAEIEADLPNSAELVPSDLREVFAWAVREGVTNVIRHSGATHCSIRLTAAAVEIEDNGSGCPATSASHGASQGHGLLGLRERAVAVGAMLVTRSDDPQGFSLAVVAGDPA
jgi:two-component system sensor histidine kinase DesK